MNKSLKLGVSVLVIITAGLLIALVTGLIDTDQLTSTLSKSAAVVGVIVLASIAILAVTRTNDK